MQLKNLYRYGKEHMARHYIENPSRETYLLLRNSEVLQDFTEVFTSSEREPEPRKIEKFYELLERRVKREPLAYISGEKEFYSRPFAVNGSVLIPRPETELLVTEALGVAREMRCPAILDIGTGSGCIAVTLACELPGAKIFASDISPEAIRMARVNAGKNCADGAVRFILGDLAGAFKESSFDIVVSNPPYVSPAEYEGLDPSVKDYEPGLALVSDEDGLSHIKNIIRGSTRILKEGGWCMVEAGYTQSAGVQALYEEAGFGDISLVKDISGIERVIKARWKK
ncbi:MAG: peptide chain release factor N(5)-glutamine methyltransferase [Candidatus Dadabacteria bacterium]|nr:peptide chain release factor N(5)-glutamine methyltransferase [Candidatus Dadabacteria bacterium]